MNRQKGYELIPELLALPISSECIHFIGKVNLCSQHYGNLGLNDARLGANSLLLFSLYPSELQRTSQSALHAHCRLRFIKYLDVVGENMKVLQKFSAFTVDGLSSGTHLFFRSGQLLKNVLKDC